MIATHSIALLMVISAPKTVEACPRGESEIVIDGALDEAIWAEASVATAFVERVPNPGSRPQVTTEFRVVYDAEHIYVGVVSYLDPGETPRGLELSRDAFGIFGDDAISLKIDTFLDQRTTVGFVTNPAGAQLDYVAVDNGAFRREYDAIWRVATSVHADRWIAEFEIPNIAIGLPGEKGSRTIGLKVTRDHNQRVATYDWNEIPPEFGPTSAIHYGRVEGLVDVAGGRALSVIPYAVGSVERAMTTDIDGKVGGDIRFRITDDVWTELTILTDFAQVDLDDPVVNLNRFPLFFPERRPFFLTGLDAFSFGVPGLLQPFFTRRIGVDDDGNVVPLLGGFKMYGTAGNVSFGALEVVTGESDVAAAHSFTIARARYNLGNHGHVGAIATLDGEASRRPNDVENPFDPGVTVGADATLRALDERLQLESFWTASINTADDETVDRHAGRAQLVWRGEEVIAGASFALIEDGYDPLVGFVERDDLMSSKVAMEWVTRPGTPGLREVFIESSAQIDHDASAGQLLGQQLYLSSRVVLGSNLAFEGGVLAKSERVVEAFDLLGHLVEPGLYGGVRVAAQIESPARRNPQGSIQYSVDTGVFGATAHSVRATGELRLGPHLSGSVVADYSIITFGDTVERGLVGHAALHIVPTTTFAIDLIGQLNELDDDNKAGLVRVRWRYLPGSDLFVVYRENFDRGARARSVALKLSFRYDAVL